ncbi:TerB family tellurite resistance protein [Nostoc sp. FACHB-973]|nr:TerB family tellurite resistance protein [Nostoc sp. FACHB-973]
MTTENEGLLWLFREKYSFSKLPSFEAYDGYSKSILICANGDGTLTPEERNWVVGLLSAFGASDSLLEELKSYKADEDIEKVIGDAPEATGSRRYLVYDAIKACSADGEYSDNERATVTKMAAKLGISEDIVKQIEEICIEEAKLRQKRLELMYPEGAPI